MARRGATTRDPNLRRLPLPRKGGVDQVVGNTDIKQGGGKSEEEVIRAAGRTARRTPVERLSAGVYRSASGDLVTQDGKPIRRQPTQGMAGQVAGGMQQNPWQGAYDNMAGQVSGNYMQQNPYSDKMYRYPLGTNMQDEMRRIVEGAGNVAQQPNNQIQQGIYWAPGFGPNAQPMPQMPQASANQGGQYRLSPGVYGTREQAMQQYNQQLQQMQQQGFQNVMPQVRRG